MKTNFCLHFKFSFILTRTLFYKRRGMHLKKIGAPSYLSDAFEKALARIINIMADWRIPFSTLELRHFIKRLDFSLFFYVSKCAVNVKCQNLAVDASHDFAL